MKLRPTLIFALFALLVTTAFSQETSDTQTKAFTGIRMTKGKKTAMISVGSFVVATNETDKYKGILDSVTQESFYISGKRIENNEVSKLKFIGAAQRKTGRIILISAPVSFAAGLGFAYWYLGSGGEWTNLTATALVIYTPIAALTGLLMLKKDKMKTDKGWTIETVPPST